MYDCLVMYDSFVTEEEERIIELSLIEAAHLFPNLNLVLIQSDSYEYLPLADMAIEKARKNEKGAVNAVDLLKTISKGADDGYAILLVKKEMFINMAEIGHPGKVVDEITNIASDNAFIYNIGCTRSMDLEDQMHMAEHSICNAIGQLVFGLRQECSDPTCMMYQTHTAEEMTEFIRRENHDEERLCKKCREKFLNNISVSARLTPSRLDIC